MKVSPGTQHTTYFVTCQRRDGSGERTAERFELVGGHKSTLPPQARMRPLETPGFSG